MVIRYTNPADRLRALHRVRSLARFLDSAFEIPGLKTRIGYDGIIGLVPGIGGVVTTGLALVIVYHAVRMGVGGTTLLKMLANVGVDFVLSEVPVAGDIADVFFRANKRNLHLLLEDIERQEGQPAQAWEQSQRRFVPNTA